METIALIKKGARVNAMSSLASVYSDKGTKFADFFYGIPDGVNIPRVRPEDFEGETMQEKISAANEFVNKFPGWCEFYFGATQSYTISEAIVLPSKTVLKIDGCTIKMADNTVDNMIRTANIVPDPEHPSGPALNADTMQRCNDIRIIGINGATLVMEDNASIYGTLNVGWRGSTILLAGVTNFEVCGLTIQKNISWSVNVCGCEYGYIHNLIFDTNRSNGDGVDIGQSHDVFIDGLFGRTYDDTVAVHSFGRSRYTKRTAEVSVPIVPYTYDLDGFAGPTYDVWINNVHTYGSANVISTLTGDYEIFNVHLCDISDDYNGTTSSKYSVFKVYGGEYTGGYYNGILHDYFFNNLQAKNASKGAVWLSGGVIEKCQINYIKKSPGVTALRDESGITISDYDFTVTNIIDE